jgi:hypothetical protein
MSSETVETPNMLTGEGRTAAEWLSEASERVRAAAHAAIREHPTPEDIAARLAALHELMARLQQHTDSCAAALEAAATRPGLTTTDKTEEAQVIADRASFRLWEICGRRYVSGLVEQLSAARGEAESLSDALTDGEGATG